VDSKDFPSITRVNFLYLLAQKHYKQVKKEKKLNFELEFIRINEA
jgi:hypothetical protein